ncbi:hypothetical protein E4U43_004393 [Claviceps pusilla]|uniref:SHSP domain-containing protein n=1 Tax=Claviceps pusilla TaxID=123648 RepID=A0A9P7N3G9_9HYPO|nr:hypothetical protein E4U43_004393 [Claviceps pusilla]
MAHMAHLQHTSHPLYVAGTAGTAGSTHPHHHRHNNQHNISWADDAHRRWLTALGPFPAGVPSAWQDPQQRFPREHGAPGETAGPVPTSHEDGKDAAVQDASVSRDQHASPSTASKEAHEAWANTYQKIWGGQPRHPGGPFSSRHGPARPGLGHWGGGAPWSAAGVAGGPRWMRPHLPWSASPDEGREDDTNKTFVPDVDVFETPERVSVHASLPGAQKEDIKVSWDPNTYELNIEGVVSRPGGDEEPLDKTLTVSERLVGEFHRSVYLGTHVDGDKVDAGGLTAVMENGVLVIDVPSRGRGDKEVQHITVV